jgi:hypothetical protein
MPADPRDKIFVVPHKRKVTFEHHGSRTISATAPNESQLDSDAHFPSKDGRALMPLDGSTARPHDMMERFKNCRKNLTYFTNQSLQEIFSLNRSYYESVIVFFPENEAYPIYNLRRKEQLPDIVNIIFFLESAFSVCDSKLLKISMSSIYVA